MSKRFSYRPDHPHGPNVIDHQTGRWMSLALAQEFAAVVNAATSEIAALKEDAERYRLLRRGQRWSVIDGIGDTLRAEALDAAIDSARATTQK